MRHDFFKGMLEYTKILTMKKQILSFMFLLFTVCSLYAQQGTYALRFDGSNDYALIGSGYGNPNTLTIELWFKTSTTSYSALFGQSDFLPPGTGVYYVPVLALLSDGRIRGEIYTGVNEGITSTGSYNDNRWHHAAMVGSSPQSLYLDGVLIGTRTGTIDNSWWTTTTIGTGFSSTDRGAPVENSWYYFNGAIDEVRIWNTARSEAEIKANMYKELAGSESGLVAYYKMSDGSGTSLTDNGDGSYTATLTNGPEWKASGCFAGPAKALDFDGSDDYVSISNGVVLETTFTQEMWLFPTDATVAYRGILGKQPPNGSVHRPPCIFQHGQKIHFGFGNGTWYADETSTDVLTINAWNHLAVIFDGTTYLIYVNGIQVFSSPCASGQTPDGWGQNELGKVDVDYFQGKIDEVRIWTVARTEEEIRENMMKTMAGNEAGLAAYYRMDYSDGTTLYEMTSNARNGTLTNMDPATDWVASTPFNTWIGSESSDWATTANWSLGVAPASSDNVGIPESSMGNNPAIASEININNLVVCSNATLNFGYSGSHTIHGNVFNIGTTNLEAQTDLTITGSLFMLHTSKLNIKPLANLKIETNLYTRILFLDGTLTIKSNSGGTGSLIVNGSCTGDVHVERYIPGRDTYPIEVQAGHGWHFLSSPVAAQAISAFHTAGSGNDFYKWSEATNLWINRTAIGGGLNPDFEFNFAVGTTGYLINNITTSTKTFSGSMNQADIPVTGLTYTESIYYKGWHLLGNPFCSALEWNKTGGSWNLGASISANCQLWNELSASYSVITPNGIIPAMNGFMVFTSANNGTLTIPRAACKNSATNWYKSTAESNERIILRAVDPEGETAQESIIRFDSDATDGFDLKYDSYFITGYAPLFYSICQEEMYALNTLSGLSDGLQIPLGFVKNNSSIFSIELKENIPGLQVYLSDLKTGSDHKLNDGPYSFTAEEGDEPNRFRLHFAPLGFDDQELSSNQVNIWQENGRLHIESDEIIENLEVFDLQGRKMISITTGEKSLSLPLSLNTGIYLVRVNHITSKLIVNNK